MDFREIQPHIKLDKTLSFNRVKILVEQPPSSCFKVNKVVCRVATSFMHTRAGLGKRAQFLGPGKNLSIN